MKEPKQTKEVNHIETRVALLEQSIGFINQTLIRIEKRLDSMDSKFESKIDRNFYWTLGAFAAMFGIMAHGFGWV